MNSIAGALLTILTSGLVSALATTFFNMAGSERQLRRAKLEEVCTLIQRHAIQLTALLAMVDSARVEGRWLNPDEIHRIAVESSAADRLRALITIYFPSLLREYARCREVAKACGQMEITNHDDLYACLESLRGALTALGDAAVKLAPHVNRPLLKFWG